MQNKETSKEKKNQNLIVPQTAKGFRDIMGEEYYRFQGVFEKAQEIAVYYGFSPIEIPTVEYTNIFERGVGEGTDIVEKELYTLTTKGGDRLSLRPEGTAGIVRAYIEHGWQSLPQPIMVYTYGPMYRHDKPQKGRYREFRQFDLEIMGSEKAIMDAMIIITSMSILKEIGVQDFRLEINSIGDKESRAKYLKDLTNYYKKLAPKLCKNCQERLKTSPLRLLDCKEALCQPFKADAPKAITSLNPESKKHFKEVLQYLDEAGIEYELNHFLVRGLDYYTHTVFEFVANITDEEGKEKELSIGGGGRYDYLAKMLGSKKDVPAVGVALGVDRILLCKGTENIEAKIHKKPKVFFVQLGLEAKLKSLKVIEMLRVARIPLTQSLSKDSLGVQLGMAERIGVPYAIIFGQKEAMNEVVIVRNMVTSSQETVTFDNLADYLKKLK
jgi:histidyl-tRNA synthetase